MPKASRDPAQTREKVIEAASRQFRQHGYAGIGVSGIAKAAGVTTGALYDHFGSKDGAFAAALDIGLQEVKEGLAAFQSQNGDQWLQAFVGYYLGTAHVQNGERLCAMTSMTPDIARASTAIRAAYQRDMDQIAQTMSNGLAGENRLERAWQILSCLVGAVTLARAMDQTVELARSQSILQTAHDTALAIAGDTVSVP